MSSKTISTFFLIATLLYATTNPLAHATFFNNPTTTLIISGRACCTATGACLAATTPGVAGAAATLNCPPLGVIATTTTDASGNFVFNVANLSPTVMPTACTVTIALPLTGATATSCPLLTGVGITGALVSPVTGSFSTNFGGFPFFFLLPFGGQRIFNGVTTGFTIQ